MTSIKVQIVSAFADKSSGGNKAGVVLNASELTELEMQAVARKIGLSETAFITKSSKADRRIRFFTPNNEVDMCGHATIATYSLLFVRSLIGVGKTTHELNVGILDVTIDHDGYVTMQQNQPSFGEMLSVDFAAKILRVPQKWIESTGLTPQVVSTGLRDVLVPIDTRGHLFTIQPDFDLMKLHNLATDTVGFHVFTLDTLVQNSSAHCRNFAPAYDILEEAATGSSSGALACYLYKHMVKNSSSFIFEQGYSLNSPSKIIAELVIKDSSIESVHIKGRAIVVEEKLVTI